MEELMENNDSKAAVQARIDDLIQKNSELSKQRDEVRNKLQKLVKNSSRIDDIEVSLTNELKVVASAEAALNDELGAIRKTVEEKRVDLAKIELAKEISEKVRVDNLKVFENKIVEALPKFKNAPYFYSKLNLTKMIEELRCQSESIQDEITNVNRRMEVLANKYEIKENMINEFPSHKLEIADLRKLKTICIDSKSGRISARKKAEYINEELKKTIECNSRKIANLRN